jgi:hypothetical protein
MGSVKKRRWSWLIMVKTGEEVIINSIYLIIVPGWFTAKGWQWCNLMFVRNSQANYKLLLIHPAAK